MATRTLSWKAERRGEVYCAPACGFNCTHAAYEDAVRRADELCEQLGPGWKPRVHENMGWYWSALGGDGYLYISPTVIDGKVYSYTVFVDDEPRWRCCGVWTATGKTPRAAVQAAIELAAENAAQIEKQMAALRDVLAKAEG